MADKHLSTQFDADLTAVSGRVMELGGLVEAQLRQSVDALAGLDCGLADGVIANEVRVNQMEVEIDRELSSIIARRQPTARDLRLLIAIFKTTANLERVGDEAEKIARMVKRLAESANVTRLPFASLRTEVELSLNLLRKALDGLARLDTVAAVAILKEDDAVDQEFSAVVRQLVTYMMEDPRTISACLDLLTIAKSIERVGDHAKNVAEFIIYIVKGEDVRHSDMSAVESAARS